MTSENDSYLPGWFPDAPRVADRDDVVGLGHYDRLLTALVVDFPTERRGFRRELALPVRGLFWRKVRMHPERSAKPEGQNLAD